MRGSADRAARIRVLRPLAQDLARALEAGQRLRELGADRDDLEDGRDQEAQEAPCT